MSAVPPPSRPGLLKHCEQPDIREMAIFRCQGKDNCPEWYEIEMADGAKMANLARRQRIASPKIMAVLAPSIYAEVARAVNADDTAEADWQGIVESRDVARHAGDNGIDAPLAVTSDSAA